MGAGFDFGHIVLVDIPDPDGGDCDHEHPAMVFHGPDAAEDLYVIAISTKFTRPIGRLMLEVPWQEEGHPITGLWRPCVLKCGWTVRLNVKDIKRRIGNMPATIADKAVEYVITAVEEEKKRLANQR